jgi:hypothetical protein
MGLMQLQMMKVVLPSANVVLSLECRVSAPARHLTCDRNFDSNASQAERATLEILSWLDHVGLFGRRAVFVGPGSIVFGCGI